MATAVLLVVVVLTIAAIAQREEIAARWIRASLDEGMDLELEVSQVDLRGLTLRHLRGQHRASGLEAIELDRLRVGWTPAGLWRGQLRAIELRGLRAQLEVPARDPLALREDAPLDTRSDATARLAAALRSLESFTLADARVDVRTTAGPITLQGGWVLERDGSGGLSGSGLVSGTAEDARVLVGAWLGPSASSAEGGRSAGKLYVDVQLGTGGRSPVRGSIDGWLALTADPQALQVSALGCLRLRVVDYEHDGVALRAPIQTCLEPTEQSWIRLGLSEPVLSLEARAMATSFGVAIGEPQDHLGRAIWLAADVTRLTLEARGPLLGPFAWQLRGAGDRLRDPEADVEVSGWNARATLDPTGRFEAALEAELVRDLSRPVRFSPVAGRASLQGRLESPRVQIALRSRGVGGLELMARGHHDRQTGRGEIVLEPAATLEARAVLAQLPPLRAWLSDAHGSLGLEARVGWGDGSQQVSLDVSPGGLDLASPYGELKNVQGHVRLLGPDPWRTPAHQELRVGSFERGLVVEETAARFELTAGGALVIEDVSARVAGGRVTVEGTYDPAAPASLLDVRLQDVELRNLLERVDVPGLEGRGALGGVLPLVVREGVLEIRGGELTARDGLLRYRPPRSARQMAADHRELGLAFSILERFRYDVLRLQVSGPLAGEVETSVYLQGRNPDVEAGREVDLTLSLTGRPMTLLRIPSYGQIRQLGDPLDGRMRSGQ